jgi:hypothetical protein
MVICNHNRLGPWRGVGYFACLWLVDIQVSHVGAQRAALESKDPVRKNLGKGHI